MICGKKMGDYTKSVLRYMQTTDSMFILLTRECLLQNKAVLFLFIILFKVVLSFQSVEEILGCDHSNENSCKKRNSLKQKFKQTT